mgnify:CR=1 FL=1
MAGAAVTATAMASATAAMAAAVDMPVRFRECMAAPFGICVSGSALCIQNATGQPP